MAHFDAYLRSLGPLAWWKLEDPVGSPTAADSSGNGYTGTVNGGVTFGQPGPVAGHTAALFDGTSGHINTTLNPTGSISVLTWLNLAGLSQSGDPRIVSNDHTDIDNRGFELFYDLAGAGGVPTFYVGNGTGASAAVGPTALPTSGWLMLVGTYDEATIRIYLGGVLVASQAFAGAMAAGNDGIAIGYDPGYSGDYFNGSIAEVAIFGYALSAAQVRGLWSPPVLFSGGSGFPQMVGQP
jgi:hypothetical protein